jgi:hypothetical protein
LSIRTMLGGQDPSPQRRSSPDGYGEPAESALKLPFSTIHGKVEAL